MSALAQKGGGGAQAGAEGADGQESDTLDLTAPGRLWCKAIFERDTTFHLLLPQKRYTKNQLTLNPQLNPADQLMNPWLVPTAAAQKDKDKKTYCDLDSSGRAAEIIARLSERYARGEPRIDTVRAVYIATAREPSARDPQVADVKDLKLLPVPSIQLKETGPSDPLPVYLTAQNFKAGRKEFRVEVSITGTIRDLEITTEPAQPMKVSGPLAAEGNGKVMLEGVEEGKTYTITVPAPFKSRKEERRQTVPIIGRFGYRGHYYQQIGTTQTVEVQEVWDGGMTTLRCTGTGNYKGLIKTVVLKAESWGSGWLYTVPPPAVRHCCC